MESRRKFGFWRKHDPTKKDIRENFIWRCTRTHIHYLEHLIIYKAFSGLFCHRCLQFIMERKGIDTPVLQMRALRLSNQMPASMVELDLGLLTSIPGFLLLTITG